MGSLGWRPCSRVEQQTGQAPTYTLWVRLGGLAAVLPQRFAQLRDYLGAGDEITGSAESALWSAIGEATWVPTDAHLIKVAITPGKIPAFEAKLQGTGAQRHYTVGGNLAWIAWPGSIADLHTQLVDLQLSGLALTNPNGSRIDSPLLGFQSGQLFAQRIKSALDPTNRLPTYQ